MLTSSNLPLSLADYRAIYHHLDSDIKNMLLREAREQGINIFYLLLKNVAIVTTMEDFHQIIKRKKYKQLLKKKFVILKTVIRRRLESGVLSYKVQNFFFFINRKLIYKKENYSRISLNGGFYYEN